MRKGDGGNYGRGSFWVVGLPHASNRASLCRNHALNRGNRRAERFHKPTDYDAFVEPIADARRCLSVDIFGHCLMPNHFHLVVGPHGDGDLGR